LLSEVNFINILQAAFAPIFLLQKIAKPNCNKKKASQNEKGLLKMLMKLNPEVDFINILRCNFSYKSALRSFSLVTFLICNFLAQKA